MFFRDDQTGWDAIAISIGLMLLLAPVAMTVHMAHRGEDPGGPDPRHTRGRDLVQFWVGAAVLDSGAPPRDLYDLEAYARAFESVEGVTEYSGFRPIYPPPIYQFFDALEDLGQIPASKFLLWGFLLLYALGIALLLRGAGMDLPRGIEAWLLLWASPAAQLGISTGQPAAFWLMLLAGGLALRSYKREILAGVVFGILCVKPTLAAPVAMALMLATQWRALAGFVLGGAGVLALSIALDGSEIWLGYLDMLLETPDLSQQLWSVLHRDFSFRSLVAVPFAGSAWVAPASGAGTIAGIVFAVWLRGKLAPAFRRDPHSFAAFTLLLAACTFATPHLLDYDVVFYFPLMIWAGYRIVEKRARRGRAGLLLLVAFYLVPIAYPISKSIQFSVGSLVLLSLLSWCASEISAGAEIEAPSSAGQHPIRAHAP